ncbi:MAG: hypothetical protein HYV59_07130 [Planctomycetes bacterium]|nr:hypothetical protein [Planctomycetota bacterium]
MRGPIQPDNFAPFPKNPLISKFFIQLGRVDELGSGILNVNKYLPVYAHGKKPQFIEGNRFRMIMPLDEALMAEFKVEGAIEGATKGVKEKLVALLTAIVANEGKRVPDYKEATGLTGSSTERYIKQLGEAGFIEFRGDATQTGGYYLTKKMKVKLK